MHNFTGKFIASVGSSSAPIVTPHNFHFMSANQRVTFLLRGSTFGADSHSAVVGIFLGGSLAAGNADAYSDIDLRVVVTPEKHLWFVDQRREIPKQWSEFLFNEWVPNAQHCVSHFRPFAKIDIFYYSTGLLHPSPWYGLPIKILHDPQGFVADLVTRSKTLRFSVSVDDVDYAISKGIAAIHEAYRRSHRGELLFAQMLFDELRHRVMQADDWLHDRTPETTVLAKFDRRGSSEVLAVLSDSYCA